jgi:tripartite-type tricarboxylate transporter receptor subunit TctC
MAGLPNPTAAPMVSASRSRPEGAFRCDFPEGHVEDSVLNSPFGRAAAALLVAAGANVGAASADPIADFYRGKTLTVTVPATAGGSFHLYGLIVAQHIGKFIPGHPSAVVQNRPGAGGVTMNNYFMTNAPKDGSIIGEINAGTVTMPLMRPLHFDARKFEWLGSVAVRTYVGALWHTVKADTIEKMQKTEVIFGSAGTGALNYQVPALMNVVLGTRYRIITGYGGGGDLNLAMERGETQARGNYYTGFLATNPDWIRDKKLKFFFVMGPTLPELKDVPRLKDKIATKEGRQMLNLVETGVEVGQGFFLPPGTMPARVAALRMAFTQMITDPDFLADATKRNLDVIPRTHQQIEKVIAEAYETPPAGAEKTAIALGFAKAAGGKKR